jgi:hypothetical protein
MMMMGMGAGLGAGKCKAGNREHGELGTGGERGANGQWRMVTQWHCSVLSGAAQWWAIGNGKGG